MDIQSLLTTAKQTDGPTIVAPMATQQITSEYNATMKTTILLNPKQMRELTRYTGVRFLSTNAKSVVSDHVEIMVCRDLIRTVVEKTNNPSKVGVPICFVGSGFREYKAFGQNPNAYFYFHGTEPKDQCRIVVEMLRDMGEVYAERAVKSATTKLTAIKNSHRRESTRKYRDAISMMKDAAEMYKYPEQFKFELPGEMQELYYEDVGYNHTPSMWLSDFAKTGARMAHVTMLMPWQLLFPDMPEDPYLRIERDGDDTVVTYRAGYQQGYRHKTSTWSLLMRRQIVESPEYAFTLMAEIKARVGPMTYIRLVRVENHTYSTVRTLELPEHMQYIRVMDPIKSWDFEKGMPKRNPEYFSVHKWEFFTVYNYAMSLDAKSVTVQSVQAMLRRSKKGISVGTTEYTPPWELTDDMLVPLAITTTAFVLHQKGWGESAVKEYRQQREKAWKRIAEVMAPAMAATVAVATAVKAGVTMAGAAKAVGAAGAAACAHPVLAMLVGSAAAYPAMHHYLTCDILVRPLVLDANNSVMQVDDRECLHYAEQWEKTFGVSNEGSDLRFVPPVIEPEGLETPCLFCSFVHDRLNKMGTEDNQKVQCDKKPDMLLEVVMSTDVLEGLRTQITTERDAQANDGLRRTLDLAKDAIPKVQIDMRIKVQSIRGPPGTGKSHTIRKYAKMLLDAGVNVGVVIPFRKLVSDYENQEVDGKKMSFDVATMHKAMSMRGKEVLFFDEYTAIDERLMFIIAFLNGAREIWLVGDEYQTGLQPSEGLRIGRVGSAVSMDDVPTHTLSYNYRCSPYYVAVLNESYGYKMVAKRTDILAVKAGPVESGRKFDFPVMSFLDYSAQRHLLTKAGEEVSVRSCQGSTFDGDVGLLVTDDDSAAPFDEALARVAISRQKGTLHIFHDSGSVASRFLSLLRHGDEEFLSNVAVYANPTVDSSVREHNVTARDYAAVSMGIKNERPGRAVKPYDATLHDGINWCSYDAMEGKIDTSGYKRYMRERVKEGDVPVALIAKWASEQGKVVAIVRRLDVSHSVVQCAREPDVVLELCDEDGHLQYNSEIDRLHRTKVQRRYEIGGVLKIAEVHSWVTPADLASELSLVSVGDSDWHRRVEFKDMRVGKNRGMFTLEKNSAATVLSGHAELVMDEYSTYYEPYRMRFEDEQPGPNQSPMRGSYDAYLLGDECDPSAGQWLWQEQSNQYTADLGPMIPVVGVQMQPEGIISPVNARGNPKRLATMHRSHGSGNGLWYGNSGSQEYQCVQRYLGKRKTLPMSQPGLKLANQMAAAYVRNNLMVSDMDNMDVWDQESQFRIAAQERNYDTRLEAEALAAQDEREIRFSLKHQFKPAKYGALKLDKVGQGICASSPHTNLMYGGASRASNYQHFRSLRDDVVYDCYMSEDALIDEVLTKYRALPDGVSVAGIDGKEFDSMQNWFTRQMEKRARQLMGDSQQFIETYFTLRCDYPIIARDVFKGTVKEAKCSGMPDTLSGNNLVQAIIGNFILSGKGPKLDLQKGDDFARVQFGVRPNEENMRAFALYCNMEHTISYGTSVEYCGKMLTRDGMFRNVVRLYNKVQAYRSDTYTTFQEYQQSVRDAVHSIERVGAERTLAANAASEGVSYSTVEMMYETIKSVSHLNEEQWMKWTRMYSVGSGKLPNADGTLMQY